MSELMEQMLQRIIDLLEEVRNLMVQGAKK